MASSRAFAALLLSAGAATTGAVETQALLDLARLTVPIAPQPLTCRLAPSPVEPPQPKAGDRVRLGLWSGLPISGNPCMDTDLEVATEVRERVLPPPRLPDGPPLSRADLRKFRARAAEDVVESYVAVYVDFAFQLTTVYGLRLRAGQRRPAVGEKSNELLRWAGPDLVVVVAGSGFCADPVLEHVAATIKP